MDNLRNRLLGLVNSATTVVPSTISLNTSHPPQRSNNALQGNTSDVPQQINQGDYSAASPPLSSRSQYTVSYADLMKEFKQTSVYLDLYRQFSERTQQPEELRKQARSQFYKYAETKGFSSEQLFQMHQSHLQKQQLPTNAQPQLQEAQSFVPPVTSPQSTLNPTLDLKKSFEELSRDYGRNPSFVETCKACSTDVTILALFFKLLKNCRLIEEGNHYIEIVKQIMRDSTERQLQLNSMYMTRMMSQQLVGNSIQFQLLQNRLMQNTEASSSSNALLTSGSNFATQAALQQASSFNASPATKSKDTNQTRRPSFYETEPAPKKKKRSDDVSVIQSMDGDNDENECIICMDSQRSAALLPCGHFKFCYECATKLMKNKKKECPYCRRAVTSCNRIYK